MHPSSTESTFFFKLFSFLVHTYLRFYFLILEKVCIGAQQIKLLHRAPLSHVRIPVRCTDTPLLIQFSLNAAGNQQVMIQVHVSCISCGRPGKIRSFWLWLVWNLAIAPICGITSGWKIFHTPWLVLSFKWIHYKICCCNCHFTALSK